MKILLAIVIALLAGCKSMEPTVRAGMMASAEAQVTQKQQECHCPPVPACEEHRGMRWDSK